MRLYVTYNSPYARLVRMMVIEKGLEQRVEIIAAQTRRAGSPYYAINPSGRVPYLVRDDGVGMEDSQLICRYLDQLDGRPEFHLPFEHGGWEYGRLETTARSLADGVSVWVREMHRPEAERSPTVLAHELERARRLADRFEDEVRHPLLCGPPNMATLLLLAALDFARQNGMADYEEARPALAAWAARARQRPSACATLPGKT
jgi:glutathione S-transferase